MRIHLKLTPNTETVPFNYQGHLVERFNKWLGVNSVNDELSLYSLSWLWGSKTNKKGFHFRNGGEWFISAYDDDLIKKLIDSIMKNSEVGLTHNENALIIFRATTSNFRDVICWCQVRS